MKLLHTLITLAMVLFIITGCDFSSDDSSGVTDNSSSSSSIEPWETTVITPAEIVEYVPRGEAEDETFIYNDPSTALGLPTGRGKVQSLDHAVVISPEQVLTTFRKGAAGNEMKYCWRLMH